MRRTKLVIAAACAATAALAAVAVADTATVADPAHDVSGNPPGKNSRSDIVRIGYDHGSTGFLTATVKTRGRIVGPTRPGSPLLWIDVPGKVSHRPGCNYSDYFVANGEVQECGEGPTTGTSTSKKLGKHKIKITFPEAAIGSPNQYGAAFVVEGAVHGQLVFFDRAPDHGFLKHQL